MRARTRDKKEIKKEILKRCNECRDAVADACRTFAEENENRVADYDTVLTPVEQLALSHLRHQIKQLNLVLDVLDELHYADV